MPSFVASRRSTAVVAVAEMFFWGFIWNLGPDGHPSLHMKWLEITISSHNKNGWLSGSRNVSCGWESHVSC